MIRIRSTKEGFRRCGIAHSKTAVDYPDGRFTPADIAVMQADPRLIVEIVAEETPDPGATEKTQAEEVGKEPVKQVKKGK
jgi:hypothetical protein